MFTTFAGGWPSLVLWMFHRSWHSSVVLGEACALDVNTFLLLLPSSCSVHIKCKTVTQMALMQIMQPSLSRMPGRLLCLKQKC